MDLIVTQPWGALGLVGLPILLAIHMLRQRPQAIRTTTLFLLEAASPRQLKGRQIDRVSKWMQLILRWLFVLVATWFLISPRWPQTSKALDIAIVVDASASMSAFSEDLVRELKSQITPLTQGRKVRLSVLSSAPGRPLMAKGGLDALARGLEAWRPNLGAHDSRLAIDVARGRVGPQGTIIFVTDHEAAPEPGVWRLSVGQPVANVAVTGVKVAGESWQATVHSYALEAQTREFKVMAQGQAVSTGTLQMDPGQTRVLSGEFPKGQERIEIQLDDDALSIDNQVTIIRPRTKRLGVYVTSDAQALAAVGRLLAATPGVEVLQHPIGADLQIEWRAEPIEGPTGGPAKLWFVRDPKREVRQPAISAVPAPDPLTDDLPWQGLVFRRPPPRKLPEAAVGLLWKGDLALVYRMPGPHLVVRIDPTGSNLDRNPGFILMLARFLEQVRAGLPREEALNLEVGVPLSIPAQPGAGPVVVRGPAGRESFSEATWRDLKAPQTPGAFEVFQGETRLLVGAARFADVRESDLKTAAPQALPQDAVAARARAHSAPDPLRPYLGLVLILLALASYRLGRSRS